MIAVARLLAFGASAAGVELLRGVGAIAAMLAIVAGAARVTPLALPLLAIGGAVVSLLLPESTDASGKVLHGLSNAPFVLVVYLVLTGVGYGLGRLGRAVRSNRL